MECVNEIKLNECNEEKSKITQDLKDIEICKKNLKIEKESVIKSFFSNFVGKHKFLFVCSLILLPITGTFGVFFLGFRFLKGLINGIKTHINNKKNTYININKQNFNLNKNRLISDEQKEKLYDDALKYLNQKNFYALKIVEKKNNVFSVLCLNEKNEKVSVDFLGKKNNEWETKNILINNEVLKNNNYHVNIDNKNNLETKQQNQCDQILKDVLKNNELPINQKPEQVNKNECLQRKN